MVDSNSCVTGIDRIVTRLQGDDYKSRKPGDLPGFLLLIKRTTDAVYFTAIVILAL